MGDNDEIKDEKNISNEEIEEVQQISGSEGELRSVESNDTEETTPGQDGQTILRTIPVPSPINPRDFFRPIEYPDHRRPLVEWIYPENYDGPRHEIDIGSSTEDHNSENLGVGENSDDTSIDYVVDPNDVEITLTVEGRVVPRRLYFLKICGFVVCDDNFRFLLNSKIIALMIGVFCVAGMTAAAILLKKDVPNFEIQNTENVQPSETLQEKPIKIDARITKITEIVLEVSGNVTFDKNTSQNKALNWILYEDHLKLAYNSSNLVQRYALMVFFYNLSGDNWFVNDGYGSEKHECKWYGILCRTVNGFDQVVTLTIERNGLKGQIPNEITILSQLTRIDLSANQISGSLPNLIGNLTKLENLYLESNRLFGTIPAEITSCINLENIFLTNNFISGSFPDFSREQRALKRIHLEGNEISGTIPSMIGTLISLEFLWLKSNRLTGTLPLELGNSKSLVNVKLEHNNLTGKIPSSLGSIPSLRRLHLSHNRLTGVVPTSIYQHPEIHNLYLNNNFLIGEIPSVSDFLPKAQQIYLNDNLINGTIPEIIGDINTLRLLSLHFSMVSGTVPQSLCDRKLQFLSVDCAGENPDVFCSCCTHCY